MVERIMSVCNTRVSIICIFCALGASYAPDGNATGVSASLSESYGKLPLCFEQNDGQTDAQVKFIAHSAGHTVFLTPTEAVIIVAAPDSAGKGIGQDFSARRRHGPNTKEPEAMVRSSLWMRLVDANPDPQVIGEEMLVTKSNYFIGNDESKWRTGVSNYGRVRYKDVYPGIDLVYYGNNSQLEYDFVVSPGTEPRCIRLTFEGLTQNPEIDGEGNLLLATASGQVVFQKPIAYQNIYGTKNEISANYVVGDSESGVQISVGQFDATQPLIIDPILSYSTFLGGAGYWDLAAALGGIAVDAQGSAYITGSAGSSFPTTPGAFQQTLGSEGDAYVAKINATGTGLVYSTYIGGYYADGGFGIVVDNAGNAYVSGGAWSQWDFPITPGAAQTDPPQNGTNHGFAAKLDPTGSVLLYSTFIGGSGGSGSEWAIGVALDQAGNAYIAGQTDAPDFPTTPGSFQPLSTGVSDAFAVKLNPQGTAFLYSTYLGGSGGDGALGGIAVDDLGNAYVAGWTHSANFPTTVGAFDRTYSGAGDGFVTKLNAAGTALVYSTYLGGANGESSAEHITLDASRNAFVTGATKSASFPRTPGALGRTSPEGYWDVIAVKLNPAGSALLYSAIIGGNGDDWGTGIAVDASGSAYITGHTGSSSFPTIPCSFQSTYGGGVNDAFVLKLDSLASELEYSFFLGGTGNDAGCGIAIDAVGNAYVSGATESANFPTTAGAFRHNWPGGTINSFVCKINPSPNATTITASITGPTNERNIPFTVVFDKPVHGFDNDEDVIISLTGSVVIGDVSVAGNNTTYTVTVWGISGAGTLTLTASTASDVVDFAGNPLATSVTSEPVIIDPNAPGLPLTAWPLALVLFTMAILRYRRRRQWDSPRSHGPCSNA